MTLNTDVLLERMKLKKQRKKWRTISVIAFFIIALGFFNFGLGQDKTFGIPAHKMIARISITDDLIEENSGREEIIREVADNNNIKAVILYIDSPGGTTVGGENLYESIEYLSSKKPVVTVMGTMATSAAYMIAMPTHRIFARNGSLTGSIGVIMQSPNLSGLAEKVGVSVDTTASGKFKNTPSMFGQTTPEEQAYLQGLINSFYDIFVDMVVKGRGMSREEVIKVADGRVFTGIQAKKLNLVDEIGGELDALSWLASSKGINKSLPVEDIELYRPDSFIEALMTSVAGKFSLLPESSIRGGLLSIWQNNGI